MARQFRLIGRQTVFEVVEEYVNIIGSPCVYGHTLDGKYQTHARVVDITWLN